MGGGGGTNTVQKADPWAGVQPYLSGVGQYGETVPAALFPEAMKWFMGNSPSYYPGQTVVNPSEQTKAGWDLATGLATGPDWSVDNVINKYAGMEGYLSNVANGSFLAGAQDPNNYTSATARGEYLNSNPYLEGMINASTRDINRNFTNTVLPGVASQFALGGRYGSGAQQGVLGTVSNDYTNKIGDVVTGIRGNAYNMERGFQEQAIARGEAARQAAITRERAYQTQAQMALPETAMGLQNFLRGNKLANINLLGQTGNQINAYNQAFLDADIDRFNYGQNLPLTKLQAYSQLLQGFGGGTQTNTSGGGSFLSNALGGAMLGNSLYGLGANAGLWGGAAGLGALGSMGLGSGALMGGATGLAATGALGGVSAGTSLFSTAAPLMALML